MGNTMPDDPETSADFETTTFNTTAELGRLIRAHRKRRQLTIETVSGLANVSPRFLSELERGKATAEIGKVLKTLQTLGLDIVLKSRSAKSADGVEAAHD